MKKNVVIVVDHGYVIKEVAARVASLGFEYGDHDIMPILGMVSGDIDEERIEELRATPGVFRVDPNKTK